MSHRPALFAWIFGLWLACVTVCAALPGDALPPRPNQYFNDSAGIVSAGTAARLNHDLADFERETSNQLVVAIFPRVPEGAEAEDFTNRMAHAWQVGQKGRKNGVILFVFVAEHHVRIQVGYGLEAVLPDATCSEIIRNVIVPAFRRNDYASGLAQGIDAIMKACRGEYQGTGATHAAQQDQNGGFSFGTLGAFFLFMLICGWFTRRRRGTTGSAYGNGPRTYGSGPWIVGGGGFGSGGRSSGGSNDTFSSGGGDFGGGGAGGNW